jgi:indolepyruvate decarboxylase
MVNAVAGAYAEKSPLVILSGAPGVRERHPRDLLHHKIKTFDTQRRIYEEVTLYATTLNNPHNADLKIHRALDYAMTKRLSTSKSPRHGMQKLKRWNTALPIKHTDIDKKPC